MENQSAIHKLIDTLWFVVLDQNTVLDYETRCIICGTIADQTGLDYDHLMGLALAGKEIDFGLIQEATQ